MYTPSCNIISAIVGPCTAGMLSKIWGFVLATTGAVMWMAGNLYELRVAAAIFGTLGIYLIIIGKIREKTLTSRKHRENIVQKKREFFYKFLLFPFLFVFSPFLLIFLRMLAFLKPSNEFIRKQTWNLVISFKGPTRLCFEFFNIFINRQLLWLTWIMICVKCIAYPMGTYIIYRRNQDTFPLPTSDRQWVMNNLNKLGTYIKLTFNIWSRALTLAVFVTVFDDFSWVFIVIYCWILWRILRYSIPKNEETTHIFEAIVLSLVTVTNLENTQSSIRLRRISSFFNFVIAIIGFSTIYVKRLHASTETLFVDTWYLNLVLSITIFVGVLSFFLDLGGAPIFCFGRKSSLPVQTCIVLKDVETGGEKFKENEESDMDEHFDINKDMLIAASEGNLKLVKSLIKAGADINSRNEDNDTGLHISARQGHTKIVRTFLENSIDVNSRGSKGMTALMIAAEQNYPDILCDLLVKGATNLKDDDGNTAWNYARRNPSADVFKVFRKWYNRFWHNPGNLNYELLQAVKNGSARMVDCLISAGANIQIRYDDEDYSFFAHSFSFGCGILRWNWCKPTRTVLNCCFPYLFLRRRDYGLNFREARERDYNDYGSGEYKDYTGLHIAAHLGYDEVVKVFLDRGIDVNIKGNEMTALNIAVKEKHSSTVKLLVDNGAIVEDTFKQEVQDLLMEELNQTRDEM